MRMRAKQDRDREGVREEREGMRLTL